MSEIGSGHALAALSILASTLAAFGCSGGSGPTPATVQAIAPPPPAPPTVDTPARTSTGLTIEAPVYATARTPLRLRASVSPADGSQVVRWTVSGTGCQQADCGTIDPTGTYRPPAALDSQLTVTARATSASDTAKSGTHELRVWPRTASCCTRALVLLIDAVPPSPPAGVSILALSLAVSAATLQPGNVALLPAPVPVELHRLALDSSLLASAVVPAGRFTSLGLRLSDPMLTIFNGSGAAIGACAPEAICELRLSLSAPELLFSGAPFPVDYDEGAGIVLRLRFDLSQSLAGVGSFTPAARLTRPLPTDLRLRPVPVRGIPGVLSYRWVDLGDIGFELAGANGLIRSETRDAPGDVDPLPWSCALPDPLCAAGRTADVDAVFDGSWSTHRMVLHPRDRPELEGVITGVHATLELDMVVLHDASGSGRPRLGTVLRVVLQEGAGFESWDAALGNTGLAFASAESLMPGQVVSVRAVTAPTGPPFMVRADRIRLRSVTLTARVAVVQNETEFLLSDLPPHLAAPRILVRHGSRASIAAGDLVSVAGYLLRADPQPVLLAERLLAR